MPQGLSKEEIKKIFSTFKTPTSTSAGSDAKPGGSASEATSRSESRDTKPAESASDSAAQNKDAGAKSAGSVSAPTEPGKITHRCSKCRAKLGSWAELHAHERACRRIPLQRCPSCGTLFANPKQHHSRCRTACDSCGTVGLHLCAFQSEHLPPSWPLPDSHGGRGRPRGWTPADGGRWCRRCGVWGHVCRPRDAPEVCEHCGACGPCDCYQQDWGEGY